MGVVEPVYCENQEEPRKKVDECESIERLIFAFKKDYMYRKWARIAIFAIFFLAVANLVVLIMLLQLWSKNTELVMTTQKQTAVIQYEVQIRDGRRTEHIGRN